ncbi:PHO2 (YDL106C) [Zygosaccharomyces parabailii]|uniref:BN860_03598g1_1 n=1 Tax=Zygosaccharomyces bailii (strain CLIB 213 / ATCC 58445 / CBS 680 / BCRC 21525 / NBRC 1098 / NCYC 1416 / NRRL Y-2227) TaxID=1333698 RepID=A0A8J2X4T4_ZYGB2|nr:PHO2 (YDL106C) [Zygosaccharomyces parabailii]CDF87314.1 BN860_03598g1_1 [Zygosaccharomyces bailii CLIB 213]CDH15619.1 related to PHO2-Homeodomain protein [Zygosaccharomyces bailii ISA1307]SJM84893.1 related to Regulatory protein PHO2 [Zygosaccharomyces bailii]
MDYHYDENFDSHFHTDFGLLSPQGGGQGGNNQQSAHASEAEQSAPPAGEESKPLMSFPSSSLRSAQERKTGKPKRTRARGEALDILKREFEVNPSPTSQRRKKLSEMTGLPEKNVRIWFQNRRAKLRKDDRAGHREGGDNGGDNGLGAYDGTESATFFDRIPLNINNNYYFIDICSITVGSWNRMKSGALRRSNLPTVKDLSNLSPISINEIMSNATDLMVLISKKNFEINYFFSAMANNTKILFRIFFPINSVVNCSLSLETNHIIDPSPSKEQQDGEDEEESNGDDKPIDDQDKSGELKLTVSRPPNFAVYFLETTDDTTNNQWSICEDFSEGRQVNDAFIGGSNLPHALKGLQNSLRFMNSLILDYNSTNQIIPPPAPINPPQAPLVMDSQPLAVHHPEEPTPFFDHYEETANDVLGLQRETTSVNDAGSHNSSDNNMSASHDSSNLLPMSHDNQLQSIPDFFKSPPELTDDTRWL